MIARSGLGLLGSLASLASLLLLAPTTARADAGEMLPVEIATNGNNYGYWEYLPLDYDGVQEFGMMVFLAGIGEIGTGTLGPQGCDWPVGPPDFTGNADMCNVLRHGPAQHVFRSTNNNEPWMWPQAERPMIVIVPQNGLVNSAFDAFELDLFFDYLVDTYAVDERRIWLTGMSQGGRSVPMYMVQNPHRLAAAVPVAGYAEDEAVAGACDFTEQAVWMFHGQNDTVFSTFTLIQFQNAISACPMPRPEPRLTVYTGLGHDVWSPTYWVQTGMNSATLPQYDPYDLDVYQFMLQRDKPVVDAGLGVVASEDDASASLPATYVDDDPMTFAWTQTSGPTLSLEDATAQTLVVSDLVAGSYTFEVLAVDVDGQWDVDQTTLTVTPGVLGGSESGEAGTSDTGGVLPGTTSGPSSESSGETSGSSSGDDVGEVGTQGASGSESSSGTSGPAVGSSESGNGTGEASSDGGGSSSDGGEASSGTSEAKGESSAADDDGGTSGAPTSSDDASSTTSAMGLDDGPSATTGSVPDADDSGADDPTRGTGADDAGTAGTTGAETGEGDETSGVPLGETPPGGCGCRSQDRAPATPWWALALLAVRRRRRARA